MNSAWSVAAVLGLEIWIFGWRFGQISGQTENYVGGFVKNALFFL